MKNNKRNSATNFIDVAFVVAAVGATVLITPQRFNLKPAEPISQSASEKAVEAVVANGGLLTCFDGENSVTYDRPGATRDHTILQTNIRKYKWHCTKMSVNNG